MDSNIKHPLRCFYWSDLYDNYANKKNQSS